jgi:citronellol/citronellal dehydrogenase
MQLKGRVVLVTGGSRGIGRATALAVGARGAAVILAARTLDPGGRLPGSLRETADALRAAGGDALPIACDLGDPASVAALAETALRWKGRVDVLVNNAAFLGKATFHPLDELSLVNWQRQVTINVTAPLALSKALVPAMRANGGGVIANVTSSAADLVEGDVPGIAYGATKAALNRLTLALARADRGRRAGRHAPGMGHRHRPGAPARDSGVCRGRPRGARRQRRQRPVLASGSRAAAGADP